MDSKKFHPSVEELTKVNTTVPCPEKDCSSVFKSESNLNLHMAKTHRRPEYMKKDCTPKEYYCPEKSCEYHEKRFFKAWKCLRQHYIKMHCVKVFVCDNCELSFPTIGAKNSHMKYCGINFTCCNCDATYNCYETLITHGRRKNHKVLEKSAYKNIQKSASATNVNDNQTVYIVRESNSLRNVNSVPTLLQNAIMIERSSQTDILPKVRHLKSRQMNQQETQTIHFIALQFTAETQTIGDYKPQIKLEDLPSSKDCFIRKDSKTQTHSADLTSSSCNTCFNLDDFNLSYERNSSSTQTAIASPLDVCDTTPFDLMQPEPFDQINDFMHTSSQTSFHEDMETFDSENYFNCNMETQTDFMHMIGSDYANICTQTGEEEPFDVFNEMGFSTSQTQTVVEDLSRSVESQTTMQHVKQYMSCHMAHSETQTDEFKQILEEINA